MYLKFHNLVTIMNVLMASQLMNNQRKEYSPSTGLRLAVSSKIVTAIQTITIQIVIQTLFTVKTKTLSKQQVIIS